MIDDPRSPTADASESVFDEKVSERLGVMSQRLSRRGALSTVGKVVFGVLGFSVVEQLLPVTRDLALASGCDDWRFCGLRGRKCVCCSGGIAQCPSQGCNANHWTSCCRNPADNITYQVNYSDCLCDSGNNCNECQNNGCTTCGSHGTVYGRLGCAGPYMCTAVNIQGACS